MMIQLKHDHNWDSHDWEEALEPVEVCECGAVMRTHRQVVTVVDSTTRAEVDAAIAASIALLGRDLKRAVAKYPQVWRCWACDYLGTESGGEWYDSENDLHMIECDRCGYCSSSLDGYKWLGPIQPAKIGQPAKACGAGS